MTRIALAVTLLALAAPGFAAAPAATSGQDPMPGKVPRPVTREAADRKEIEGLLRAMTEAGQKGDVNAAAELVDFPVLMVTDDSKGEAMTDTWDREKWLEVMTPLYKPMPNVKMTNKPAIFVITDSLATVGNRWTMTMGGKATSGRSMLLLVRKGGHWRIKSMVEGGWGDSMQHAPPPAR